MPSEKSVFADKEEVLRRFTVAVREALLDHKRAGNPVAVWRDGKVVIVPPEEIAVESLNPATSAPQRPITRDEK